MNKTEIVDSIYAAYGTDSGILFGIKERSIVYAIVEFTLARADNSAYKDKEIELLKLALLKTDYREELERDLSDAEKEIERLKGLIETLFKKYRETNNYRWQQFKTENNL